MPMTSRPTPEQAETLALRALGYLAAEPDRLGPFLDATGLSPATLRAAAQDPGFLAAVLDHVSSNDSLLLELAANLSLNPEILAAAHRVLSPPPVDEGP